jgi:methyl-accepting chemotaxis protein
VEITGLTLVSMQTSEIAGEKLAKLTPDIQKTAELVQQIAYASAEQNTGAQQINSAIQLLDQDVQKNASVAEQLTAASAQTLGQMESLRQTMQFFKVARPAPVQYAMPGAPPPVPAQFPAPAAYQGQPPYSIPIAPPAPAAAPATPRQGLLELASRLKQRQDTEF